MARPVPEETPDRVAATQPLTVSDGAVAATPGVIDVSRPYGSAGTFGQVFTSVAGVAGIVVLVPFAMLLVGLPVAAGVRGLLEIVRWFLPGLR